MELGMIGLGKMGNFMAQRLMKGGHRVIGFDPSADARKRLADQGGEAIDSLEALPNMLKGPRVLWLMVPAGQIVDQTLDALGPKLQAGDIVIDGGNSNYKDTMRRAQRLAAQK